MVSPAKSLREYLLSALRAARKSRGERLEPRTELIEARGHGLGALFGGVGALALGRRLVAGFGQIVGDGKRGHDDQALIADFPERLAHFANFVVDYAGQRFEAGLLALVAGNRPKIGRRSSRSPRSS